MTRRILPCLWIASSFLLAVMVTGAEPRVVFEDRLAGKLGDGWTWLRENPGKWRFKDNALEICVEPGVAATVKNALVRKAPARAKCRLAFEVTITFTAPPTRQYEQAGLTWYHGDKPVFKLVHELINGELFIIPGKKPAPEKTVQLRLIVTADRYEAQFRADAKGEFQTAASGPLAAGQDERISLQCYNGPPDAEHWFRFANFRILELP
ncbi:MAG: hypothetical protein FJ388_23535 [Verrucomicrobia bacterium]|nr:hypothetical protein [Verrucomicrobiota bacterium]